MKRRGIELLLATGITLLALGLMMLSMPAITAAQEGDSPAQEEESTTQQEASPVQQGDSATQSASYIGSSECSSCHRSVVRDHGETNHALALRDTGRRKTGILADFSLSDDLRTVTFPGEDAARAFTQDDIAYAIGSGRYTQSYVFKAGRTEFYVLPAQWNVVTQSWEPLNLAEQWPGEAYNFVTNCAGCHTVGLDAERARWVDDGVQCEACHGPGSEHEKAARGAGRRPSDEDLVTVRGAINVSVDPQVCGQCHIRAQTTAGAPPYPLNYRPGGALTVAGSFVPFGADDPVHFFGSGHARMPNMQYNEWLLSGHAESLNTLKESSQAADECLGCHSQDFRFTAERIAQVESGDRAGAPLDPLTVETAQFGVTCTACHSPHDSNGITPTGSDAEALCSGCHRNPDQLEGIHHPSSEMFEGKSLVSGIDGVPGVHATAEDGPRCTTCHMPSVPVGSTSRNSHSMSPIIPGQAADAPPDTCSGCHKDLSAADLQSLVEDTQKSVLGRINWVQARLATLTEPETGTDARAKYDEASAAAAFVQNDGSMGFHNYQYADALLTRAERIAAELSVAGRSLQPTEAPAPTATAASPETIIATGGERRVPSGIRPVTILLIGLVILSLLIAAVAFFRKPRYQEM